MGPEPRAPRAAAATQFLVEANGFDATPLNRGVRVSSWGSQSARRSDTELDTAMDQVGLIRRLRLTDVQAPSRSL